MAALGCATNELKVAKGECYKGFGELLVVVGGGGEGECGCVRECSSVGWCVLVLVLIHVNGGSGIRSCCFVPFEWRSLPTG